MKHAPEITVSDIRHVSGHRTPPCATRPDSDVISGPLRTSRLPPPSFIGTNLALYALLSLAVFLLALTGIYWRPFGQLSALWPANAVLLGLFLRMPALASPPGWLAATAGFVIADLVTGSAWLLAVSLSLINLLSVFVALIVCIPLSQSQRHQIPPDSLPRIFAAMLAASGIAGVIGGPLLWQSLGGSLGEAVTRWAVSELLAYIIFLPCILSAPDARTWRRRPQRTGPPRSLAENLIAGGSLLAAVIAGSLLGGPGVVAFPVIALLICALSCGLFMTSLLTLAFSLWTLLGIAFGSIQLSFDISDANDLLSLRLGAASTALAPLVVASVTAARERSLVTLRHLAEHDALTGLLNHRAFHQRARNLLALLANRRKRVAVLMVDIDHFKRINDTYGHAAGDEVLSRVSQRFRETLRSDDICGRVGGEEFAAVIPHCTSQQLETLTRRIHGEVRQERFEFGEEHGKDLALSVSIGATLSSDSSEDLTALLIRADQALYAAKQGGRDQTRIA